MEWISLLQGLAAALIGGGTLSMLTRNGRRRDKAETERKEAEAKQLMIANYEERIKDLHDNVERLNKEVEYYIGRVAEQNHTIDSKTELIRSTNQKLWESEQETNRVNEQLNAANHKILALTKENAHLKEWKCVKPYTVCDLREPEQKVKHERYTPLNPDE